MGYPGSSLEDYWACELIAATLREAQQFPKDIGSIPKFLSELDKLNKFVDEKIRPKFKGDINV